MALFDIEDFVEKLSDMETQSHPVVFRNRFRVFAAENPPPVRGREFQFVPIVPGPFGRKGGTDFGNVQMTDPDQLVVDLLPFGFQLHFIRKGLPTAASADAEMLAERVEPVR